MLKYNKLILLNFPLETHKRELEPKTTQAPPETTEDDTSGRIRNRIKIVDQENATKKTLETSKIPKLTTKVQVTSAKKTSTEEGPKNPINSPILDEKDDIVESTTPCLDSIPQNTPCAKTHKMAAIGKRHEKSNPLESKVGLLTYIRSDGIYKKVKNAHVGNMLSLCDFNYMRHCSCTRVVTIPIF